MAPSFLELPLELVVQVLSFLRLPDLLSCQLTNHFLLRAIKDSVILQYLIATEVAGVEDNPNCVLSLAERLDILKHREMAWACCSIDFRQPVLIQRKPTSIYDFTDGIYLLGDSGPCNHTRLSRPLTQALSFLKLPSHPTQEPTWSHLDINRTIIDVGLAIYEHDLIAVITSTEHEIVRSTHSIEIVLIKFSTGAPHPSAGLSTLYVDRWTTQTGRPAVLIEIVGNNLALVTKYPMGERSQDTLHVYDWIKGTLIMEHKADYHTYSGLVFLSPDVIVLPNVKAQTLELWRIPDVPTHNVQFVRSLSLPQLTPGTGIRSIVCRGEPNPTAYGLTYTSPESPFHCSATESIIVFNLFVEPVQGEGDGSILFVVHRRSLLSLLPCSHSQDALEQSSNNSESIPWCQWGPPVTRWVNADDMPTRWITITAGQRLVIVPEAQFVQPLVDPVPIVILDFNPYNVRRQAPDPSSWVSTLGVRNFESEAIAEPVESHESLPFFACQSDDVFAYDGVLMDEERILGIRTNAHDVITSVEILHIG